MLQINTGKEDADNEAFRIILFIYFVFILSVLLDFEEIPRKIIE